ncbi:MAG: DUF456 domain-containing protein [Anaerolineaceae bacterium]|nr:DUF456 domain-containing protein [Anaerolineaceae bacterium]
MMDTIANSSWFVPVLAVIMGFGLIGLMFYIIPGLVIIWLAILVYGIVTGFTLGTGILFAVITLLMIIGSIIDNLLMGAEAKKTGASWVAVVVALAAGVVGTILLPPFGGLLFAAVGILIVEWVRKRDLKEGAKSAGGILKGCGFAVIARFGIGMLMIGLWVVWLLWL